MYPTQSATSPVTITSEPLASEVYNTLPERGRAYAAASLRRNEKRALQSLIVAYGLEDLFSIQVIYKQQPDLPANRILLYEATEEGDTLCYTQPPSKRLSVRGLSYRILPNGRLGAYEFAAGPQPDMVPYTAFLTAFIQASASMDVAGLFGLALCRVRDHDLPSVVAGQVTFDLLQVKCRWPPNLVGLPECDDWACCMSSRRAGKMVEIEQMVSL